MAKEPKIDISIDDQMLGVLLVTCGECGHKNRWPLRTIAPSSVRRCPCGQEFRFDGADLRRIHAELDKLKADLRKLRK